MERKPARQHDYPRTVRFAAFGGMVAGPLMVTWYFPLGDAGVNRRRYRILERYVTIRNPNAKVLARVCLDQFVFAPPNIAVFFTAQSLMEGESVAEIKAKLNRT